jgi:hypothetical protein
MRCDLTVNIVVSMHDRNADDSYDLVLLFAILTCDICGYKSSISLLPRMELWATHVFQGMHPQKEEVFNTEEITTV